MFLIMDVEDVEFKELDCTETRRYGFSLIDFHNAGVSQDRQIAYVVCSKGYVMEDGEYVSKESVVVQFVSGGPLGVSRSGRVSHFDKGLGERLRDCPEGLRNKLFGGVPVYAGGLLKYAMREG